MGQKIRYFYKLIKRKGLMHFFIRLIKKILGISDFCLMPDFRGISNFFQDKVGLEIGGPSKFFAHNGCVPVYPLMAGLDGVNFSSNTIWTGSHEPLNGFWVEGKKVGELFISDAVDLSLLGEKKYDFILSCNNIEHIANPLKAIKSWLNFLKIGGLLVIVAPRKESNFDCFREVVSFEHLLRDYTENVGEDDLTHLEEILRLHDLSKDLPAGNFSQFKIRCQTNFENRCLHHHVFDLPVLIEIADFFKLKILKSFQIETDYVILAQK